jgi:hypothetical protein
MKVIALTAAQAAKIAGTGEGEADLEPVPYHLGGYILGLAVLDDPAHADVRDYLAALPLVDYVAPPPEAS